MQAVVDGDVASGSGVAHADVLVAFSEAVVADDEDALVSARAGVLEAVGSEGFVDAAAVASNFERMVRIADSTGIPLDASLDVMSEDLRQDLDLARFGSSANTPARSAALKLAGHALRPLVHGVFRFLGARYRRAH